MTMSTPSSDTAAIRQIIRALRAKGYVLIAVWDGEERVPVTTETEAIEAITAVDDATLTVAEGTPTGPKGWVLFVMGNDPEEVAADYTINLSHVLDPLTESWWS